VDTFSIWHWLVVLAALATIIPAAKALSRVGLSPWWSILSVIPVVGWFGLWAFAYARWPKVDSTRANFLAKFCQGPTLAPRGHHEHLPA
jgi:hypothetical protein